MPKFIHFGCWNKGGCFLNDDTEQDEKNGDIPQCNGLTSVMKLLQKEIDENGPYNFISIAGDNYYPTKISDESGEKIKIFVENDFKSGFNCLPKNIPIHVIMGNHDYEKFLNVYNKDEKKLEMTNCKILENEYNLNQHDTEHQNISTKMYDFFSFDENTKILMIDTTMYDDKYIGENIDCYLKHSDLSALFEPSESLDIKKSKLRDNQKNFIQRSLSQLKENDNLIIIGHHPITGYKTKKSTVDLIDSPGEPFIKMLYNDIHLDLINEKHININYYYLCADLHQYQIGNISVGKIGDTNNPNMFIKQYIVGTGGADLDNYDYPIIKEKRGQLNKLKNLTEFNVNYFMTDEEVKLSGKMHGFLVCETESKSDSTELLFKFIIENPSDQEKPIKIEHNGPKESIEQLKELLSQSSSSSLSAPASIQDTIGSFLKGGSKRKTYKKKNLKKKKTIKNKGKPKIKKVRKTKYTKKKKYVKTKRSKK